jgi:fibronectin type 3 domain-containing protein
LRRGFLALVVVVLVALMPIFQMGPGVEVQQRSDDLGPPPPTPDDGESGDANVRSMVAGLGGAFLENRGQLGRDDVAFYASGDAISVAFGHGWVDYSIREGRGVDVSSLQFRVRFLGAVPVAPVGTGILGHPTHFLIGGQPAGWVTGVRSYSGVLYEGVWDGVDLGFCIADGYLKYDLLVRPGADVGSIAFSYEGVDCLRLEEGSGDLLVTTSLGVVREDSPTSYQVTADGDRVDVASGFSLVGDAVLGFDVPDMDPALTLVIDPGVEFSSFFGASGDDRIEGSHLVDFGPGGTVYIAGTTSGDDLPITPGAFCDTFRGGMMLYYDAFVAKFSADGSTILYCTYLGGTGTDTAYAIDVDASGQASVVGYTFSDDFPVSVNAHVSTRAGSSDGYYVMLDPSGSSLVHGTYLGGSAGDAMYGVKVDGSGNAYVLGQTSSDDYPTTPGAFRETYTSDDIVVTKLSTGTGALVYSTHVPSAMPSDLAVDASGRVTVAGYSDSNGFPTTPDALYRTRRGAVDGVVFQLKADGSDLEFSTFFGGNRDDMCMGVALNSTGGVWICGQTYSNNLPVTADAFQGTFAGSLTDGDGFFARIAANGSAREYASYYGVQNADWLWDIELMDDGQPVVVGVTNAGGYLMPSTAFDGQYKGGAATGVLAWLDTTDGRLVNATYLGDVGEDLAGGGTLDIAPDGSIAVTGSTWSMYFPTTPGANDTTYDWQDVFVMVVEFDEVPWEMPTVPLNLQASGGDGYVDFAWDRPMDDGGWPIWGYYVYRGETPGCYTFQFDVTSGREYSDMGLDNGIEYHYLVSAYNVVGEGPLSEPVRGVPYTLPWEPKNLTVTGGRDNITVAWEPPLDSGGPPILGYKVHRGDEIGSQSFYADVENATTFVDTTVVSGTRYHYKVQAYHEFASGAFTPVKSAKSIGVPTAPLDIDAVGGNHKVVLTWTPPASDGGGVIVEYWLFRGTSADDLDTKKVVEPGISYTDTNLTNGQTYYYSLSAVNGAGEGPRSAVVNATPRGVPDWPRELVASEGDGEVTLTWAEPLDFGGSDLTDYSVYRGVYEDDLRFLASAGLSLTYTDDDVENGETYYYNVRANNEAGEGVPSSTVSATPMGLPSPPDSFSLDVGECQVELSWLSPADDGGSAITVYRVYRGTAPDAMAVVSELDASSTSYTDLGVEGGVTYFYRVTASNSRLEGSPTETLTAVPCGVPSEPLNVSAECGDGAITLKWSPPANEGGMTLMGYNIYMGPAADELEFHVYAGYTHSLEVPDLENGLEYFFAVAAVNQVGEGPRSSPVSGTCVGVPDVPGDLAVVLEGGNVVITWTAPETDGGCALTGYHLHRGVTPDTLSLYKELGVLTTYTDLEVEAGTTYYYAIQAVNDVGEGGSSTSVSVDVPKAEGGDEEGGYLTWVVLLLVVVVVAVLFLVARGKESTTDFSKYGEPVHKVEEEEEEPKEAEEPPEEPKVVEYGGDTWEADE